MKKPHPDQHRVIVYGINYAPEMIGVGRFTTQLCDYLAGSGADIDVITTPPHYPEWKTNAPYSAGRYMREQIGAVRVYRCPIWLSKKMRGFARLLAPLSFALSSAPVAMWRILTQRPDIVIVMEPAFFAVPVALLAAKLSGAKTLLHVQDLEIDAAFAVGHIRGRAVQKLTVWAERHLLRAFDRVVTISEQMRKRLLEKGVDQKCLYLVRNWVDLTQIKPIVGRSSFRDELRLSDQTLVALYAGSVGAKQGLNVMLDAAKLLQTNSEIVFVVAGDGPAKADLLARYGHLQNVRFLPLQPEARLSDLLGLADVHILPQMAGAADLVLPSKLGGMLASARHILATANPDTELYDFLSGTAVIVPAGDSAGIAREVLGLATTRPETPREKLRGLASAFDATRSLAAFADIISDLGPKPVR